MPEWKRHVVQVYDLLFATLIRLKFEYKHWGCCLEGLWNIGMGFKDKQLEAIKCFCAGQDDYVLTPMGYGKSLIYVVLSRILDRMKGRCYKLQSSTIYYYPYTWHTLPYFYVFTRYHLGFVPPQLVGYCSWQLLRVLTMIKNTMQNVESQLAPYKTK